MGAGRKCCKFGGPGVRARLGTWRLSRPVRRWGRGPGAALALPSAEGCWTLRAASQQWKPGALERVGGRRHPLFSLPGAKDGGGVGALGNSEWLGAAPGVAPLLSPGQLEPVSLARRTPHSHHARFPGSEKGLILYAPLTPTRGSIAMGERAVSALRVGDSLSRGQFRDISASGETKAAALGKGLGRAAGAFGAPATRSGACGDPAALQGAFLLPPLPGPRVTAR